MPGRVFHHIAFRVQHGPPDGERTLSECRLQPRSLVHEQAALHHHRCIQELGVHQEHDHLERCRQRRPTSWTREYHHCHRRGQPQGGRNPESDQVFNTMAGDINSRVASAPVRSGGRVGVQLDARLQCWGGGGCC